MAKKRVFFLGKNSVGKTNVFWTDPGERWKPKVGDKIPGKIGEGWVASVFNSATCDFISILDAFIDICTSRSGGDIFQHVEALFRAGIEAAKFEIPGRTKSIRRVKEKVHPGRSPSSTGRDH
ncbi:MAG: hypothetical protein AAB787_00125 [Patescibacteria group bacterium]